MRIGVTGSGGKLGRATVERLRADGHEVMGFDLAGTPGPGFTRVDLTDFGQTLDAFLSVTARHDGLDALVHLAAIPVNGLVPDAATFHNNMTVSFNALFAAHRAGIRRIVLASSITAMGFPFDEAPPSLPVDETYTSARNTYGLGKVAEEAIAAQLVGWHAGTSITALRVRHVRPRGRAGLPPRPHRVVDRCARRRAGDRPRTRGRAARVRGLQRRRSRVGQRGALARARRPLVPRDRRRRRSRRVRVPHVDAAHPRAPRLRGQARLALT